MDPNAVIHGNGNVIQGNGENARQALFQQRTKTKVATQEQDKVAKYNAKFKSKIKVQIKHGKKCKNPKHTKQETGRPWTGAWMQTDTMNEQGVKGKHRLNTQMLMNRQGTGEEKGGRRPGMVTRRRSTEEKTRREQDYRQREPEGRT